MGRGVVLLVALALFAAAAPSVAGAGGGESTASSANDVSEPQIHAVYPNPVADEDAGEFVTLVVPRDTRLGRYALADDEETVPLPTVTASGRLVFSTDPNETRALVDDRVHRLSGMALSNAGEPLRLLRNGTTVDTLTYEDAPEGKLRRATGSENWRALGATDWPVVTARGGTVRAFVLPDAPSVAVEHLRSADDRILLGAYTLTSERVADALVAARQRNVTVRVLVDGEPVGGLTRREATLLDRLAGSGVEVRAVGGQHARYDFHHAKYAVVDERALVTTENWKPAGVGGASSRGWGVVTDQHRIVTSLADLFQSDAAWHSAVPWEQYRAGQSFQQTNASTGTYPSRFSPRSVSVNRTRLLVAPDNAETAVVGVLDNATESIAVEQVSIGGRHSPFLQATLDAARRGVRVRILLSSAWYAREENRRLVDWLNDRADSESLPVTARLAEPAGRFEKIHAKGVVVDGDQVVLGSLNWNNNSARDNREVAVVLAGEEVGSYFQRVFDADWPGGGFPPLGYLLAIGVAAAGVLVVIRRLRFADDAGVTAADDGCLTDD
jgi:phosphatidylserine/phosphatidylglycerophosphate/cardiolipin synthase-like enzyme